MIQIVDHEIQDHVHVGAPLLEERQAVALDEPGLGHPAFQLFHGGVIPLQVPHHENKAALPG